MLIIFAFYSFSLSVIVFKILAENGKNRQNSRLKANNSYKESSDDFGVTETFVELDLLIQFCSLQFFFICCSFGDIGQKQEKSSKFTFECH